MFQRICLLQYIHTIVYVDFLGMKVGFGKSNLKFRQKFFPISCLICLVQNESLSNFLFKSNFKMYEDGILDSTAHSCSLVLILATKVCARIALVLFWFKFCWSIKSCALFSKLLAPYQIHVIHYDDSLIQFMF